MNVRLPRIAGWVLAFAVLPAFVLGDKITLKDGSVLEGTAIKSADGYWFKGADGARRQISDADIASFVKGSGASTTATPNASSAVAAPSGSLSLSVTRARAERSTTPVAAVAIWQEFIEGKISDEDLKIAKGELEKWKGMQADGSEKIRGRWVGGSERKQVIAQAQKLLNEALERFQANQALAGFKKLEEAQQVYPNSFQAAFWLGFFNIVREDYPAATGYFNQALHLRPNSPEAMANLALIQLMAKRDARLLGDGIISLHKAAQSGDCREIAQDLVTALAGLPDVQKKSGKMRAVADDANLLASKYAIKGPIAGWLPVPLRERVGAGSDEGGNSEMPQGAYYSGTGFVISADGLILTNRHVVKGAKTMTVQVGGHQEKTGKIIMIDDEQDLALVQVTVDHPLPFLQFSATPAHLGADCTIMGFPLIDRFGPGVKITRGVVAGTQPLSVGADVMVDAKVNPGNSGGPILDRFGNVMGIVSMKSLSTASEDSFGLGISAAQIKKFLEKNKVVVHNGPPGTATLSTEDIVAKTEPATVCILSTH